jgi:ribosomal protein S18 acetylase RimI-like enzyme
VTLALVPFAVDQPRSLALASDALRTRLAPGENFADLWPPIDSAIRTSHATGGLVRSEGEALGIVVWEPAGPLGVAVRLLYLSPPGAAVESYRAVLDLTEHAAGPIAFAPGPLAGLSAEEESTVMTGRGFAAYGRLEMGFPATAPIAPLPAVAMGELRPVHPEDEPLLARLHEDAYRNHLDRYLSIEDLDPARDADHQVRDYFSGRWGLPLSPGSAVVALDGRIVAAALAVRRPAHVLIIDVMTDPVLQGKRLGRTALAGSLRDLRERGETAIVLNVTEANQRATRLYSGLGFVRTMGPSQEWYNARRMRVEIPPTAAAHSVGEGADSAGR